MKTRENYTNSFFFFFFSISNYHWYLRFLVCVNKICPPINQTKVNYTETVKVIENFYLQSNILLNINSQSSSACDYIQNWIVNIKNDLLQSTGQFLLTASFKTGFLFCPFQFLENFFTHLKIKTNFFFFLFL